jgi:L-lactate utilization protein LutC
MEKKIKEFVNDDGTLISGKIPVLDPKITAKTTTDKSIKMRSQPFNWTIYNVKLQETDLPYSEQAMKMSKDPSKFYEFLQSVNEVDKFEEYFEKKEDYQSKLKEVSKQKAYSVIERILSKRGVESDVLTKKLPTIEEIKNKEILLLDKLTKIAGAIKEVMNEDEKKVILSYFTEQIK